MEWQLVVYCLVQCLAEDTWSIMGLAFEIVTYVYPYKGHLENKATAKRIGAWWYLFHKLAIWEKQMIRLGGWNFGYHKIYRFNPEILLQVEKPK